MAAPLHRSSRRGQQQRRQATSSLLLALCLAAAAAGRVAAQTCPPPSDDGAYPFPFVTSNFCSSVGINVPNNGFACAFWGLFLGLLTGSDANQLFCANDGRQPQTTDAKGYAVPQALPDRRQGGVLPAQLPGAVLDAEGATYHWLYRNTLRFAGWSACGVLGNTTAWAPPTGWQRLATLRLTQSLKEYNISATSLPATVVLKQRGGNAARRASCRAFARDAEAAGRVATRPAQLCEGGQLLVLTRGTLSAAEGRADFDYRLMADANYGAGQIHVGFRGLANQVWPGLKTLLDREFVNATGATRHLVLSGHSLGAGVSTLLGARAQKYLQQQCADKPAWASWPGKQPLITVVLFAAPNVGNNEFVKDYNARVNTRNVNFVNDLVSQVPCSPQVTACPNAPVPTPNPAGAWQYGRVGGVLSFDGGSMPFQPAAWQKLDRYRQKEFCDNRASVGALKSATHVCSYLCRTSAYLKDERLNWCLLWQAADGSQERRAATYCYETVAEVFPINSPVVYPPRT